MKARASLIGSHILTALLWCPLAKADPDTNLHFAAHAGTSFTIDTISYGVYKKHMKYPKTLAFLTTLTVGLVYKLNERPQDKNLLTPMAENVLGASIATITIYTFEF